MVMIKAEERAWDTRLVIITMIFIFLFLLLHFFSSIRALILFRWVMMEYFFFLFCGFGFHRVIKSIQKCFFFLSAFLSCSPSPCKNNGVCITKPKAGSYCKWVSRLFFFSFTVLWWFFLKVFNCTLVTWLITNKFSFIPIAAHLDMLVNFVSTQTHV